MARTENQRSVPRWLFIIAAVLVAGRIAVAFWPQPTEPRSSSRVRWVPMAEAKSRAAQSGKPILYEFSADWCGPCKVMEREVFDDEVLAARINEGYIPVHVVDRQQEDGTNTADVESLESAYRVQAFPTVVVAGADGNLRGRMQGYSGRPSFARFLDDPSQVR
jgi:thiol:disulfide interchange protein